MLPDVLSVIHVFEAARPRARRHLEVIVIMTQSNYHLDIPSELRRHTERDQFTISALWLAGFSAGAISKTYGLRPAQVLGIVHRSGFEMRSNMTDEQRQAELNFLRKSRLDDFGKPIDGSALDNFDWQIRPLDGRKIKQRRKARAS